MTSLLVWAGWQILVILWTPIVALALAATGWWDRPRWLAGRVFRFGARVLVALNPFWKVRWEGSVPARRDHPFVAVSNHESMADIVLIGTLPWDMKWLSKASIFRIPFLGLMMRMAGDVPVRREDPESRGESYQALSEWLNRGASVMIFPEGTRSRTKEMLPFRNGAFRLAIETGKPIQPLAVVGTRDAIRKGSMLFGRADVVVRILDPITTNGMTQDEVEGLRERVRTLIESARADLASVESRQPGPQAG